MLLGGTELDAKNLSSSLGVNIPYEKDRVRASLLKSPIIVTTKDVDIPSLTNGVLSVPITDYMLIEQILTIFYNHDVITEEVRVLAAEISKL